MGKPKRGLDRTIYGLELLQAAIRILKEEFAVAKKSKAAHTKK